MPRPVDPPELTALLVRQDGVVARWQAERLGLRPHDIERRIRRRLWVRWCPGVYLDHTGERSWRQRAWAAVLACWPAALLGPSAVRATEGCADDDGLILVAVDRSRSRVCDPPGARVKRVTGLRDRVQWNASPPRQRYEDALIDVAAACRDEAAAVAVLSRAVNARRTTAQRLSGALMGKPRVAGRSFLSGVLDDIAQGVSSVLEHGYLVRVERAHGLPRSAWQVRASTPAGVVYRDADYGEGAVVELDGVAHHTSRVDRDADLERDLHHAAAGGATLRLGYRQVFVTTCTTTVGVVRFLRARGITVDPRPCRPGCPVAAA